MRGRNHRELLNEMRPKVPQGDDLEATNDLLNFVLRRSLRLSGDVERYADERFDDAPISSLYVTAFAGIVAFETLEWVKGWPK